MPRRETRNKLRSSPPVEKALPDLKNYARRARKKVQYAEENNEGRDGNESSDSDFEASPPPPPPTVSKRKAPRNIKNTLKEEKGEVQSIAKTNNESPAPKNEVKPTSNVPDSIFESFYSRPNLSEDESSSSDDDDVPLKTVKQDVESKKQLNENGLSEEVGPKIELSTLPVKEEQITSPVLEFERDSPITNLDSLIENGKSEYFSSPSDVQSPVFHKFEIYEPETLYQPETLNNEVSAIEYVQEDDFEQHFTRKARQKPKVLKESSSKKRHLSSTSTTSSSSKKAKQTESEVAPKDHKKESRRRKVALAHKEEEKAGQNDNEDEDSDAAWEDVDGKFNLKPKLQGTIIIRFKL